MRPPKTIRRDIQVDALRLAAEGSDDEVFKRLSAIADVLEGLSCKDAAANAGCSARSLRGCVRRSVWHQFVDHQPDCGDVDHRLGCLRATLIVFGETPRATQPGEGPFDDPSQAGDLERLCEKSDFGGFQGKIRKICDHTRLTKCWAPSLQRAPVSERTTPKPDFSHSL